MSNHKVAEELKKYLKFKEKFEFKSMDIVEKDGIEYCHDQPLQTEDGTYIPECDQWLNVGYKIKSSRSKVLSNLYLYEFDFMGFHLKSIEAFFQSLKFKDPSVQQAVFSYSGTDAYHIQAASDYNWKESGYLYWQGQRIKRDSSGYDLLVDELYISAVQNPLYRQALKNVAKPIIHSIGRPSKTETVFTRAEFEKELNSLSAFLRELDKDA